MNNLLTLDEAAARLQTSRRTLRRAIAEGRLRAVRLGESARSDRIDPDDLPTREGWYWVKDGDVTMVVCVAYDGDELAYNCRLGGDWLGVDSMFDCQWAGPIPLPVEREGNR